MVNSPLIRWEVWEKGVIVKGTTNLEEVDNLIKELKPWQELRKFHWVEEETLVAYMISTGKLIKLNKST